MKVYNQSLSISPTDLSYFFSCRHRAARELSVAHGARRRPVWNNPLIDTLVERGLEHEARYVQRLKDEGKTVLDLGEVMNRELAVKRTQEAMQTGVDCIVQAGLAIGSWYGRPDVLLKVPRECPRLGAWSYEPADAKLARETRGGTIIQLGLYCDMLETVQGCSPERFHVVAPEESDVGQTTRSYRFHEYGAYFRLVKAKFGEAVELGYQELEELFAAEPVDHCTICPWWGQCYDWWKETDHLSLVAGIARLQRRELTTCGIVTVEALAQIADSVVSQVKRGSRSSYERVRDQARVQIESRRKGEVVYELIPPVETLTDEPLGLARLPEPSPGDIFLDLEGDRLASDGGRDYLFGLVTLDDGGAERYQCWWASTSAEERVAFETVVDLITERLETFPDLHIYHYAPYEVTAFKRLMGRYASREDAIDRFLRGKRFVDLYGVVRQGVRVGVEQYSIKNLEPLYSFQREAELRDASHALRRVEQAIELGRRELITEELKKTVEAYNKDDCVSTHRLRDWLEEQRAKLLEAGHRFERPEQPPEDAPESVDERTRAVEELRRALLDGVPDEKDERTAGQQANYQLAYLLDWHRREDKVGWWEYFRLLSLPDEELLEERKAVSGLVYEGDVGQHKRSTIQRFRYPAQELEIGEGDAPMTLDGKSFGKIADHIPESGTLDVIVGPSRQQDHPSALVVHTNVSSRVIEESLFSLGQRVRQIRGVEAMGRCPARALLLRETPRLTDGVFTPPPLDAELTATDYAVQIVTQLDRTTLAIQGPPGAGKTYTGARMILAAVKAGMRVGVTAASHKVINNLLEAIVSQGELEGVRPSVGHKGGDHPAAGASPIRHFKTNGQAEAAILDGTVRVLGGTPWLWARPEFEDSVDLLFIDEAGQLSLANALGVARSARSLVLLGDPQQLEQPSKGTHPDGAGLSALQHILGDAETMPPKLGLFLSVTWRMAPSVCAFTSELFYAGQLRSRAGLENQALLGGPYQGNGLWLYEIEHDGNANSSDEESEVVERLVSEVLQDDTRWRDQNGYERKMRPGDIRIVAPFNAQVNRIHERLRSASLGDVPVGTVDMFQGQEAAVVIYSMASSRPEDAPRGMEFLYSLNRFNVATSRARCVVIVVASPHLFEPDCQTPRQMRLANALCRYRELACAVKPGEKV